MMATRAARMPPWAEGGGMVDGIVGATTGEGTDKGGAAGLAGDGIGAIGAGTGETTGGV